MRALLVVAFFLALAAPFHASAQDLVAVFVHEDKIGNPVIVLPMPEINTTVRATLPSENSSCAYKGSHKVQQWVPVTCPPPMTISLRGEEGVVKVELHLLDPNIFVHATASATESMALDFANVVPNKNTKIRVETVVEPKEKAKNPSNSE